MPLLICLMLLWGSALAQPAPPQPAQAVPGPTAPPAPQATPPAAEAARPAPAAEAPAAEAPAGPSEAELRLAGWQTCTGELPNVPSQRAIAACTWLLEQNREPPSNVAVALYNRGNERRRIGQHEAAAGDFTAALAIVPSDPATLLNRAIVRRAMGDRANALVDLNAALRAAPGNPNILANRCITRRRLGEGDAALADCDAAIARAEPGNAFPHVARAGLSLRRGMDGPAASDLTEALRRDPRADKALRLRAVLRTKRGRVADAQADIAAAQALSPRVDAEIAEIFGPGLVP